MQLRIAVPLAVCAALLGAALTACGGSGKSATPTSTQTAGSSPSATREATPSAAATATSAPLTAVETQPASEPQPTANSVAPTDVPPPPPPVATSTPVPPPPPPPPADTHVSLVAEGTRFMPVSLTAPVGGVTIVLDNRDAGIAHNVNVFSGDASIGSTSTVAGPITQTLALGTVAAGSYSFVCDVHPLAMHGVLTVQ